MKKQPTEPKKITNNLQRPGESLEAELEPTIKLADKTIAS